MNYDFEESGKRDHVNINDFDVLNRISSIINSEFGSNDAAIARYLVAHIRRSSEINVARNNPRCIRDPFRCSSFLQSIGLPVS